MPVATLAEVQAWLSKSKFDLTNLDLELEETARLTVLGSLGTRFDTSGWTDEETTPSLVSKIVAMLVAAMEWRRATAEGALNPGVRSYADILEEHAKFLIGCILGGTLEIDGIDYEELTGTVLGPTFFPTDAEEYDEDYGRRFLLGMKF